MPAQVIPWLTCYAVATVVSLAALSLKAKMFRDQIRRRRTEFVLDDEEQTDRIVKLLKHTIRFAWNQCVVLQSVDSPLFVLTLAKKVSRIKTWDVQPPALTLSPDYMGRLVKAKRAIQSTYAAMLVGLAECLPLGVLQVCTML
jgi:hypothetical protein